MFSPEAEQRVLDLLVSHYHASYPKEAVGVIMRNSSVIRFANWSPLANEFRTLGTALLFAKGWKAWRHGRGVSYIYHSHRGDTTPSETDEAFMRHLYSRWPHVQHLIFTPDRQYDIWKVS